jgi:hypothetical protein
MASLLWYYQRWPIIKENQVPVCKQDTVQKDYLYVGCLEERMCFSLETTTLRVTRFSGSFAQCCSAPTGAELLVLKGWVSAVQEEDRPAPALLHTVLALSITDTQVTLLFHFPPAFWHLVPRP